MAADNKHWIEDMHMKKGALTKKADKSGESPMDYASKHKDSKGKTGKQARLAIVLKGLRDAK